ncbi:hypothetical protein F5X96DRAFT_54201 [Biscogniauxia mediterranea]|nr:hypothetical protein F5X96DRAFT_54201 [Biscogniauxia mediterranea]
MADTERYQTPKLSQNWFIRLAFLLSSVLLAILLHRFIIYLFRLATTPNTSRNHSTNEPGTLENTVELEQCRQESNKLVELWQHPDKSSFVFISLDLGISDENEHRITDIGLSRWCIGDKSHPKSYHYLINRYGQNQDKYMLSRRDPFLFGETEFINESDIGLFLSYSFSSMTSKYGTICLVCHDVSRSIRLLQPYWEVPSGVLTIDTLKIWRAHNGTTENITLEQCLFTMLDLKWDEISGNAGNRARSLIQLLHTQGQFSISTKTTPKTVQ